MKTNHVFKFSFIDGRNNISIEDDVIPLNFTFDSYMKNLRRVSNSFKDSKGFVDKGFQSLVEAIIVHFEILNEYIPTSSTEHKYKTYGFGKKADTLVSVFCSCGYEIDELMTDGNSGLTEFFSQSCYREGFNLESDKKIFNIFTDAKALHENTINNFVDLEKVQFYGYEEISKMIDANVKFWDDYRYSLLNANNEITKASGPIIPYDFQVEALIALSKQVCGKCQIILPTGSGKTEIMMRHSISMIDNAIKLGNPKPKVLFVSPRIDLGKQGIGEFIDRIKALGLINYTIVNFSSGEVDKDNAARKLFKAEDIIDTTNIEDLWKACRLANGPILIFTTYHSVNKIEKARIPFILTNADEAHNIVKGRSIPKTRKVLTSDLLLQNSPMIVFYTATQALSESPDIDPDISDIERMGYGMDNTKLFGPVIYRKSPSEMIINGIIADPQVCHYTVTKAIIGKHSLDALSLIALLKNAELNSEIIWETYAQVEKRNEEDSINSEMNGIKYLVKCNSVESFSELLASETFKKNQNKRPDVHIHGINSTIVVIDGVEYKKDENSTNKFRAAMLEMRYKPWEKVIVLHVAMLDEGLNVPGINAVLTFGEMGDITSSQTLGRGMRNHDYDITRLRNKEISHDDRYNGKFFKPFCYVVMVDYAGFPETKKRIESMVEKIHDSTGRWPYPCEVFVDEGHTGSKPIGGVRPKIKSYQIAEEVEGDFRVEIIRTIAERKRQSLIEKAKRVFENTLISVKESIKNSIAGL